jgi:hypothetical protein
LGFLCAVSQSANGQLGFKGGIAVSGYRATHSDVRVWLGEDYRPFLGYEVDLFQDGDGVPDAGVQLGAFYTRRISGHLAVQPEVYFAQRGLIFDQIELYNASYHLQVSYLQLPVLLRYGLSERNVRPSILFGPYAGLRLSSNRTIDSWGERDTRSLSSVKALDYGLMCGIGAGFDAWSQPLILEARLEWGLAGTMSPLEQATDLHDSPGKVNLISVTFLVGWKP